MLLKKLYKLGKGLRQGWFMRTKNKACSLVCTYYESDVCVYYKPGCVEMLRKILRIYRYIPYQDAKEKSNSFGWL